MAMDTAAPTVPGPLTGVRILEVSLLGPAAITTTLADLGAAVGVSDVAALRAEEGAAEKPKKAARKSKKAEAPAEEA